MNSAANSKASFAQLSLFDVPTPAQLWDVDSVKHAFDDLFSATLKYKSSRSYKELMSFVRKFRFYSPYNSFLIHVQMPGACFVAPSSRWKKEYGRRIKPNANPILILQPMGPVMFVFDVMDTEPEPGAKPLPPEVDDPFAVRKGHVGPGFSRTIENAKRDGIRILEHNGGSQSAGSIRPNTEKNLPPLQYHFGADNQGQPQFAEIPLRYEMLYNGNLTKEAAYVTIVHELAHLYSGHLGTPNRKWWPDRRGLDEVITEFEAESVVHLVCTRLGLTYPSDAYLSDYLCKNNQIPEISLECVMKAAGLIENMGKQRLKPRKDN